MVPAMTMFRTAILRLTFAALMAFGLFGANTAQAGMNCVQFVQSQTKLGLHGDAWKWWNASVGQFDRGNRPQPGSVLVFSKTRILPHGHVALVKAVQNSRSILIDHANWSPIHGRRGQVERSVQVIDVSAKNDWSRVRVWYAPTAEVGQTNYAVTGFIYPRKAPLHHHGH